MSAAAATFVLVHGAWHGGWCWRRVAERLAAAGHRAYCPTLTGLGERAHLLSRAVDLDTHVADIVGVLEAEELDDVVLVGHSYGGIVASGVAARATSRIRRLVFLDAALVEDGERWSQILPPETAAARRKAAIDSSGGVSIPPPDPAAFGLADPRDLAWVGRRLTPHPFATFDQTVRWGGPIGAGLPKVYLDCRDPVYPALEAVKARYRGRPGWTFETLAAGHDAMVGAPDETARRLLAYA
ncbi:MAG: alpha/beta fold hydrolase [Burkholderiales bacterium]|nr:alpha/beta fold hydrolase [Burkholderiales bacterium]